MNAKNAYRTGLLVAALVALMPQASLAQFDSNAAAVTLTATLNESMTMTASPSEVTFALAPSGEAEGSVPVTVTTNWVLGSNRTSVNVYAYFASATNALIDGGGNSIDSQHVFGLVATGSPTIFTPFAETGPFGAAGASLKLYSEGLSVNNFSKTRNDNLRLKIDLTAVPATPAGVYVGTLNLQARAL